MKKSTKIELINLKFGTSYIKAKKLDQSTDLGLYVRSLELLVESVKEFESYNIKSPMIKIAFSTKFKEEMEKIEKLEKSLVVRNML